MSLKLELKLQPVICESKGQHVILSVCKEVRVSTNGLW